jgi:integrase
VISVLHSFFAWAEVEDLVKLDPSRKIRRPPKRKPDVYRPSLDELERIRAVAVRWERPAILLMEGAGLRRSEVVGCRWADIDLIRGRVRIHRKGHHWHWFPVDPDVLVELRASFAELQPELDDYVFVPEIEQWVSAFERERRRTDPKTPSSDQALMRMVWRVCARAGVRRPSPHQCGTVLRIASYARVVATSLRFKRLWVIRAPTRRSSTPTRSSLMSSQLRLKGRPPIGCHKRRQS